jgi:glycosyltransferase involved in cell wall biosynthesis
MPPPNIFSVGMKVLHVTQPCGIGGAGIACERLHQALLAHQIDSEVVCESDARRTTRVVRLNKTVPVLVRAGRAAWERFARVSGIQPEFAPYCIPAGVVPYVNHSESDVVHLHWFTQRFLSLREIPRIRKPCVWTLHDLWPASFPHRYPVYQLTDQPIPSPLDSSACPAVMTSALQRVARWAERNRVHLICLSKWQEQLIQNSRLLSGCSTSIIPNPIDTERFAPFDKSACRRILGLDESSFIMVTAANPHAATPGDRKGGDLLARALTSCASITSAARRQIEVVVLGHTVERGSKSAYGPITTRLMGHLADDISLAVIYSAADVCVVPSRMETFGLVAAEAQACSCPVVGFASTGTKDVVLDGETGLLATPFDGDALAGAIGALYQDEARRSELAHNCREHVCKTMSYSAVAASMSQLYSQQSLVHR